MEALAGSVGEANANFRRRLSLDAPDPVPALAHQPAQDGPEGTETAAGAPAGPPQGRLTSLRAGVERGGALPPVPGRRPL